MKVELISKTGAELRRTVGGKRGGVDRVSGTGVDDDTMAGKDELGLVPAGKQLPVVRAYYQMEAAAGVEALQGIKGVQGVVGAGQTGLEVGGAEAGVAFDGAAHEVETHVVGQQAVAPRRLFQGVAGGDEEPHLVKPLVLAQVVGQGQVAYVHGVERAAEDAYPGAFTVLSLGGRFSRRQQTTMLLMLTNRTASMLIQNTFSST